MGMASPERARDSLQAEVFAALSAIPGLPPAIIDELSSRIEVFAGPMSVRRATVSLRAGRLGASYWAIRNDNIDLVARLGPAIVSIVALMGSPSQSTFTTVAACIVSIIAVVNRLLKKGVALDAEQHAALLALRCLGPCSAEALAGRLTGASVTGRDRVEAERLARVLLSLKEIRARDGSVESLVTQAADGLWSVNGI